MSCKSASFYIKEENLDYIVEQIEDRPRYNKSNWLDDLIDHLRSKTKPVVKDKKPVKRFVAPSLEEVKDHMASSTTNGSNIEAEKFCDFYKSNDWKVGKNKMKDWKAAVRNWLRSNKPKTTTDNWDDDNWHKDLGM